MPEDQTNDSSKTSTRERILDAALNIFSSKGYHDTRLDEIVDEAHVSKGSIYFHFPNKEKLFLALVDQFSDLLERRVVEAIQQEQQGMDRIRAALSRCWTRLDVTAARPKSCWCRRWDWGQSLRRNA